MKRPFHEEERQQMQRVTITIDRELLSQLDGFMNEKNYDNRSEAIRDMVRDRLEEERLQQEEQQGSCFAALTYVYDHEERELAKRLTQAHHRHHGSTHAALHVHIDEDTCLETVILKGNISEVKNVSTRIIAERGVRHGAVHLVPVEPSSGAATAIAEKHQVQDHKHEHDHEHKHVHDHEHTHDHDHWHTHKDGTYHTHSHTHTHSHAHEHIHEHEHAHSHRHEETEDGHTHSHDGSHEHDFRAHDHDHLNEPHGPHAHDHPGHETERHDDHSH